MDYIISNGTVVNEGTLTQRDLFIHNGLIVENAASLHNPQTFSAKGCYVLPGVIDTHVHFRDPGFPAKADFATESHAALAGGVTSVIDMPNTNPQTTTLALLEEKEQIAAAKSAVNYGFMLGATNDNIDELLAIDPLRYAAIKLFLGSSTGNMRTFVDDIIVRDRDARAKLLEIWSQARNGSINEQHLCDFIDQQERSLMESQKLNFMRWPMMNELVHENPTVWGSYAEEVENVRRFVRERLLWMDKKLGYDHIQNGIADMPIDIAQSYQIYTLSGMPYNGDVRQLPQGIYIVKQGNKVKKIRVTDGL
jgi:dihydroorotase-like cyclic amidohydrolase